MRKENEASVKKSFDDSENWLANEVAAQYVSASTIKQNLDSVFRTNFSGSRNGANDRGEAEVNARLKYGPNNYSEQDVETELRKLRFNTLSGQLKYNDYLNGEKSIDSFDWVSASSTEREERDRAIAFKTWLESYGSNISGALTTRGITTNDEIESLLGGMPLNLDN